MKDEKITSDVYPLLRVELLRKIYNENKANEIYAVDDISFEIFEGETFGLVGESGSGKSTTGKLLMKLEEANSGSILFNGKFIKQDNSRREELLFRKNIQMIFQDPYASLNPRMTIRDIIGEPLEIHKLVSSKKERNTIVDDLLEQVGLSKAFVNRYPRELSGGQCQRVGIARALAVQPKFIIADEAISALDVSIQAQIVNLLIELKKQKKLTYLFIAHDLSMVKYISDRIAVMNHGRILELASSDEIYAKPLHPYTESLLSAIPEPNPIQEKTRQRIIYDESKYSYPKNDPAVQLYEITPEHFVYCHADEVNDFRKKHEELSRKVMTIDAI